MQATEFAPPSAGKPRTGSWRRVSWAALPPGQVVRITQGRNHLGLGRIEGSTSDGSVIWVTLQGSAGRRMFHKDDGVHVELGG
jgi:hypothetical protein